MSDEGRARAHQMYADLIAGAGAGIEEFRRMYVEFGGQFTLPEGTQVEPVDAGGVRAEWISPPASDTARTIVFFHGGGYVIGDLDTHRNLCARLAAAADARVLAVDYRLGPENVHPAASQDALSAVTWAFGQGADPASTVLCGDSAGGGLTLLTLIALRDAGGPQVAGAAVVSPWVDLTCSSPSFDENADDVLVSRAALEQLGGAYVQGAAPLDDPAVSPLYADLSGLPPTLILVSSVEALRDDGVRFAEKASAAGSPVTVELADGMEHVWPVFDFLPEAEQAIGRLGDFVRTQTAAPAAAN